MRAARIHRDGRDQRAMRKRAGGHICCLRRDADGALPAPGNEQEAGEAGAVERAVERGVGWVGLGDGDVLDVARAERALIDVGDARRQRDVRHAREVEGVGGYGGEGVVGALVGDGSGEGEAGSASFAGVAFIGPFGFAAFGGSAQDDGGIDADELDGRFPCDRVGQAVDGEGAYDRFAIEGDIGVDERGGLARKGRGEGTWLRARPFGFGTFGPFAQGCGRLAFRISACTAIRSGAFRSFFRG